MRTSIVIAIVAAALSLPIQASPALPAISLELYVDQSTGSDSNTCLSPGLACSTIQAAIDRIPMVITDEVTVFVAPGAYEGGVTIADRSSPYRSLIRIKGQPGVILWGDNLRTTGITIWRSTGVSLEDLEISGFTGPGVYAIYTDPVIVRGSSIMDNTGSGIRAEASGLVVENSVIWHNKAGGILVERGRLVLGEPTAGSVVDISYNRGAGVTARGADAVFAGATLITRNDQGVLALHGGVIDLAMRADAGIFGNYTDMMADCHGMVAGYAGMACGTECACTGRLFGVCIPGSTSLDGGGGGGGLTFAPVLPPPPDPIVVPPGGTRGLHL